MRLSLCLYFFVIFKISEGKISIDVTAGTNKSDVTINYSGVNLKIITENEINMFRVNQRNMYEALKKRYGKKPSTYYLTSPTPWGDLYTKYNWEQVTRILVIKSARVKSITEKPVIVMSQDYENRSNKTIKVNTGISQTVESTITTSWSKSNEFTVSQEIEYDVNFVFGKASGTTGFSFTSTVGKSEEKSETFTVGSTTAVETELLPNQSGTAVLSANRGYLEIEVVYLAKLRGNVAVNFRKKYKDHHFWGPPIEDVMKDADLSNEVTTVETIKVGFYADASLKVFDKDTGMPL